jgi:hypothetical protein
MYISAIDSSPAEGGQGDDHFEVNLIATLLVVIV